MRRTLSLEHVEGNDTALAVSGKPFHEYLAVVA
jgi:hypothetical protein